MYYTSWKISLPHFRTLSQACPTPLESAFDHFNAEIITLLIKSGADVKWSQVGWLEHKLWQIGVYFALLAIQ
jgi:hypothetical protein